VTEWLGNELYAYVPYEAPAEITHQLRELERELDSEQLRTQLIVAFDPASTVRSGGRAELWFDTERVHVFDPKTGENLTRDRDRTSGNEEPAGVSVTGPPATSGSG
jgi:multiple sugar transport system ATP-binding protein